MGDRAGRRFVLPDGDPRRTARRRQLGALWRLADDPVRPQDVPRDRRNAHDARLADVRQITGERLTVPSIKRRNLSAFMQISLDGYFCDVQGDMSFAHKPSDHHEWQQFVAGNAARGGVLLFGRTTYEMMAAWWPTPAAAHAMPEVARQMNALPKLVFSRTLASADWNNTTVVRNDPAGTVRRMKAREGPDMTILGSGSIVTQLAAEGLVDTIQVVVKPVALGAGRSFLSGLHGPLDLTLTDTRTFRNGSVVLWYAPGA